MRTRIIVASIALLTVAGLAFFYKNTPKETTPEFVVKGEERTRFHIERVKYEMDLIKDPVTGKIPKNIFELEREFALTLPVKGQGSATSRPNALNNYLPAGPNNIGGRTRAVKYDVRYNGSTNRVIIAGCVSGGILRSADGGNTWTLVTPQGDNHSFTALVQDPRPGFEQTWYAGGGEYLGNSASEIGATYFGYYLWKSVNGGLSWSQLPLGTITNLAGTGTLPSGQWEVFDHPFDFVHKMEVNPLNGDLYIAGHRRLIRSTDAGATFRVVFESSGSALSTNGQMDIDISTTGRIFLAVNGGAGDFTKRGVWISNTGNPFSTNPGDWTRIAGGQTLGVDSVANWRGNSYSLVAAGQYAGKRILITLAPSNQNIAYVMYENGLSSDPPTSQPEADSFRVDIVGTNYTWSNRSPNMPDFPNGNLSGSDPITLQGGYDMIVKVNPADPNTVYVGGTNLYRSFDGFATTNSIAWINGYQSIATFYNQYPNGHADIHEIDFNPTNPAEAICANDGGIQVTQNINAGSGAFILTPVNWTRFPNYQTLQYYYVAIDPDANRNNFIGGAQDNSTYLRDKVGILGTGQPDSNNHVRLIGGDGTAVGISKVNVATQSQYLYGGSQLGNIRRIRVTGGSAFPNIFGDDIKPNNLTANPAGGFGEFVTNFRLDFDNTEDLYYVNFNRLFRTTSASSVSAGGWTELQAVSTAVDADGAANGFNVIRAMAFSRGEYASSHAMYIGTSGGKIYRIDDPRNQLPGQPPVDITPIGLVGNVQDIAVNPNNDDEIMAVVSNYGITVGGTLTNITNIYWTTNAKSASPTWVPIEGNLGAGFISGRSCAIVVKKDASNNPVTEYYVGTHAGLYSTTNVQSGNPTWQREGGTLLNLAIVQSLGYRPVDNVLLVGTHGNGMYYAFLGTPNYTPNLNTGIPIVNDGSFIRTVYPTVGNSRVNFFTGSLTSIRTINVELLDMKGRVVYRARSPYQNGGVDLGPLSSGVYILNIRSDEGRYRHTQKLVRQ